MRDAVISLFGSRKFLVMLFSQLALAHAAYFKLITPELAAEIGSGLAAAWMASHAHEEKSKIDAASFADSVGSVVPEIPKAPSLPQLAENAGTANEIPPPPPVQS